MSFGWYRRRAESSDGDDKTVGKGPQRGDRELITSDDLGLEASTATVLGLRSPRAKGVKQLAAKTDSRVVMARQWVRDSHNPEKLTARTIALSATGVTKSGDVLASTYASHLGAVARGEQMKTLRHATDCVIRTEGEATDIFAFVGPSHWLERYLLTRVKFEEVETEKVAANAVRDVRDWLAGEDLLWLKLESLAAKRAAAAFRTRIEKIDEVGELILRLRAAGLEPDERVTHRYQELQFGLDFWWVFFGLRVKLRVDREPSVEVIEAANGRNK